jgi:hypothetical protein
VFVDFVPEFRSLSSWTASAFAATVAGVVLRRIGVF